MSFLALDNDMEISFRRHIIETRRNKRVKRGEEFNEICSENLTIIVANI
jgi:hypothetical protein